MPLLKIKNTSVRGDLSARDIVKQHLDTAMPAVRDAFMVGNALHPNIDIRLDEVTGIIAVYAPTQ